MTTLDDYDVPLSTAEAQLTAWVDEALALRHDAGDDPEGPIDLAGVELLPNEDVLHIMGRLPSRTERVNGIKASVTRGKGRIRRAATESKFEAEIAYDTAMQKRSNKRREFTSAKEMNADASLDSLDQRRNAHKLGRLVSFADEAYEIVQQVDWQLSSMRTDLREILRSARFESSIDH